MLATMTWVSICLIVLAIFAALLLAWRVEWLRVQCAELDAVERRKSRPLDDVQAENIDLQFTNNPYAAVEVPSLPPGDSEPYFSPWTSHARRPAYYTSHTGDLIRTHQNDR